MAVTRFQATVLRRIAHSRIAYGETYIAGGLALNHQLNAPRVSHDIDVFSDGLDFARAASSRARTTSSARRWPQARSCSTKDILAVPGRRSCKGDFRAWF